MDDLENQKVELELEIEKVGTSFYLSPLASKGIYNYMYETEVSL